MDEGARCLIGSLDPRMRWFKLYVVVLVADRREKTCGDDNASVKWARRRCGRIGTVDATRLLEGFEVRVQESSCLRSRCGGHGAYLSDD